MRHKKIKIKEERKEQESQQTQDGPERKVRKKNPGKKPAPSALFDPAKKINKMSDKRR